MVIWEEGDWKKSAGEGKLAHMNNEAAKPSSESNSENRGPQTAPKGGAGGAGGTGGAGQTGETPPKTNSPAVGGGKAWEKGIEKGESGMASAIDTIESVIIALILALTFRAFVVEAFVIPTGSMAPTLLGAHFNVICPNCGLEYAENADLKKQYVDKAPPSGQPGIVLLDQRAELINSTTIVAPETRICPNCAFPIDITNLPQKGLDRRLSSDHTMRFPWANNGDRILVMKYLYNIIEPQRWDVIVFKEPLRVQDNYIKRLIGLPGEKLELIAGDVFINDQIARKPVHVQKAVWQLVYDNDLYPRDAGQIRSNGQMWTNPWRGRGATKDHWTIKGPVIRYAGAKDQGEGQTGELVFGETQDFPFYLHNVLGYNLDPTARGMNFLSQMKALHKVGDLHLETLWTPTQSGDLRLTLGFPSNEYKVVWTTAGQLELWRWEEGSGKFTAMVQPEVVGAVPVPEAGRSYHVVMNNVDRQIQLFINGTLVLNEVLPWTVEEAHRWSQQLERAPEQPVVRLETTVPCTLAHVKLMRDLYYTNPSRYDADRRISLPGTGTQENPVVLDQEEYFALGDNSPMSHDSRGWEMVDPSLRDTLVGQEKRYGRIPRRLMLGRAFFVYWPAGFRPMNGQFESLTRYGVDFPLVPNVGEMRFIR